MREASIESVRTVLVRAGYKVDSEFQGLNLVGESRRAVVAVCYFENYQELHTTFLDVQSRFVAEVFNRLPIEKQWDAYLILITPQVTRDEQSTRTLEHILNDTSYCRKMVVGSSKLDSLKAWQRVLAPILPVEADQTKDDINVIEAMSELLRKRRVAPDIVSALGQPIESLKNSLQTLLQVRLGGESHAD